jgi:ankyrin repeat protein
MGLDDLIDKYKHEFEEKELKEEEKSKAQKEGITVYDGKTIRVIQPTTEAAACHYGRGTRWCTAATEGINMFGRYNKQGPLYIIIPKKPHYEGEKYQIHFETDQYMDKEDKKIAPEKLIELYPELSEFHLIFATMKGSVRDVKNTLPSTSEEHINRAFLMASKHINGEFLMASKNRDLEIVRLLLEKADVNANNSEAFLDAVDKGYSEFIQLLLESGAHINAQNGEALHIASDGGNLKIVQLLLENGANVNARDDIALRAASKEGHLKIVQLLLENGANVNAQDDYALRVASASRYLEIVQLLLEKGANVNAQDDYALRIASLGGHLEIVKLLVEKGADVNAKNGFALNSAILNDNQDIAEYLLENGADFSKIPKRTTNYKKYAKIYNKAYFKREEKAGNLTDWEDICRYLNEEYRLPQLKSIASKLDIKYDSKITKKELCQLISLDYDAWIKEENKDEKNPRVEIHKKQNKKKPN